MQHCFSIKAFPSFLYRMLHLTICFSIWSLPINISSYVVWWIKSRVWCWVSDFLCYFTCCYYVYQQWAPLIASIVSLYKGQRRECSTTIFTIEQCFTLKGFCSMPNPDFSCLCMLSRHWKPDSCAYYGWVKGQADIRAMDYLFIISPLCSLYECNE